MNFKIYLKSRVYLFFRPLIYINQFFDQVFNRKADPTIAVFNDRVIRTLKSHEHSIRQVNIARYSSSSKIGTFSVLSSSSLKVLRNKHVFQR